MAILPQDKDSMCSQIELSKMLAWTERDGRGGRQISRCNVRPGGSDILEVEERVHGCGVEFEEKGFDEEGVRLET